MHTSNDHNTNFNCLFSNDWIWIDEPGDEWRENLIIDDGRRQMLDELFYLQKEVTRWWSLNSRNTEVFWSMQTPKGESF